MRRAEARVKMGTKMRTWGAAAGFAGGLAVGVPGVTAGAAAQTFSPADSARVDSVFAPWAAGPTPGYAVGVVRGGRLVFARGYGLASVEHGAPLTARSPVYLASMGKQFTAACVALLVLEGRLRLTDDVRRYVPALPDYAARYGRHVTVADLLHHTSGVREYTSLMLQAGQDRRFEHHYTNRDVLALLARQRALNFAPGAEYRYSSSNYVLLTAVVERVTGQSLPTFARARLFGPLGMRDTFFEADYATVVPGRVESYAPLGPGPDGVRRYERRLKHFDVYGDGGALSTVEDLARWDAALTGAGGDARADSLRADPTWSALRRLLLTPGRLASGDSIPYAWGLEHHRYRGHRTVEHNGGMLAFTTDLVRFPDAGLSVVVLGNTTDRYATELALAVADGLLPGSTGPEPDATADVAAGATVAPTAVTPTAVALGGSARVPDARVDARVDARAAARRVAGHYWSRTGNHFRRVVAAPDGHVLLDFGDGDGEPLTLVGLDGAGLPHYVRAADPRAWAAGRDARPRAVRFAPTPGGGLRMVLDAVNGVPGGAVYDRYDPTPPTSLADVAPLAGTYRSGELGVDYTLALERADERSDARVGDGRTRGRLTLRVADGAPVELYPRAAPGVVWNARDKVWVGFAELVFTRDAAGRATGFDAGDQRVSRVHFARVR